MLYSDLRRMISMPNFVSELLREYQLGADDLLAKGRRAAVYALGPDRVFKVWKTEANRVPENERCRFYGELDASEVDFETPEVLELRMTHEATWSVERRIEGVSLTRVLPGLEGTARRDALLAYADTAAAIRRLRCARMTKYGELLVTPRIRSETWAGFVLARARKCLAENRDRLAGLEDQCDRALEVLKHMLVTAGDRPLQLVHGNYHPSGVLVRENGTVSGVLRFGALTVMGDATLDLANALLFLRYTSGITSQDIEIVGKRVREHGLTDDDLARAHLFLAFRLLEVRNATLFTWCVEAIVAVSVGM